MMHEDLPHPGWGDAANDFSEGDELDGTTDVNVPALDKPHSKEVAGSPAPTTFAEHM